MFYNKIIKLTGWDLCLVKKSNYKKASSSFQRHISEESFFSEHDVTSDEIYFSGEHPFIHIKQLNKIEKKKIRKLHSKIWNEGRSPFLAAITPTEMRLYNCYEPPVENDDEVEGKLQIDRFEDIEADLKRLVDFLHQSKIDSGKIWIDEYGKKINTNNRVDRKLVANLKNTRAKLYDNGNGLLLPVVHALLGRALFIFYLEDRKILTTDAFPKKPRGVESFSDLLSYKEETYELFEKLREKFNGDLFPVSKEEKRSVKQHHLASVRNCFYDLDVTNGQASMWKMFQFDFIPIELISAIYEEFMSEEEKEKNGQIKIKENGAYYTKPMLVEFMLNEVLPWPDENNKRYDYKILDPACGSGIFLVESYRRLIARWKFSKNRKKIDEDSLRDILLGSIYGIDKDTEAIKVAAFSLYLTFLNYLEPVEIRNDYIEKKRKKFAPLIQWSDQKELSERKDAEFGSNLFQFNTFATRDIVAQKFDIIIGNPPWKKDKPEPIVAAYIDKHNLPAQIACAYLDYMPTLAPDGVVALVVAAKILFNIGSKYEDFRQKFFRAYEVETVINLAVVRDIMFDNASAPGAVIIYRKSKNIRKEHLVYCVPKNIKTIDKKQSLVIDASEVKYLAINDILKRNSKVFKIAMWGGMRDYLLIAKLQEIPGISTLCTDDQQGTGLHSKDDNNKTLDSKFKDYKIIPLNKVQRYYTPNSGLKVLGDSYSKYRAINKKIFMPPMILLKRGTIDTQFCCSFIDYKSVFTDRIYGLSLSDKTINYSKALVASLNSSLATYYLFLISSTWAVDKQGDTLHEEIISFPAITEKMKEETINILAQKVDEISGLFMNRESETLRIENEIDETIYAELDIRKNERYLIDHVLNNSIGLQNRYNLNSADNAVNATGIKPYLNVLSTTLCKTLVHGNSGAWVEILNTGQKESLHLIIINFSNDNKTGSAVVTEVDSDKFGKLIREINNYALEQHSESIYYRKVFKYYKKDKIYIIKPNEKRFWTTSEALNDADTVLAELINAKKN